MGPAAHTDYEGFPGDTPLCHQRDSKSDDARSRITAPGPVAAISPTAESDPQSKYREELLGRLKMTHAALREQQRVVRQEDQEEPLLFSQGIWCG